MKYRIVFLSLLGAAACTNGTNPSANEADLIRSGFVTPQSDGSIDRPLLDVQFGQVNSGSGGVSYAAGLLDLPQTDGIDAVAAYAGLQNGTTVATPARSGTLTFDANYELALVNNIAVTDGEITGDNLFPRSGDILITANFGEKTLTGTDGSLSVDGQLDGKDISGSVSVDGVQGDLTGLVGKDHVFGAFHGANDDTAFAGGFAGPKQ